MKKEKDEITDLFRTRLSGTGMNVRDGFWEQLSQDIPLAAARCRRLIGWRVAAAASVLLVLAASSAVLLYYGPRGGVEEAFTPIAATDGGRIAGDGVQLDRLPVSATSVLPKPVPKSYGLPVADTEEEDTASMTFSMSFSFSATTIDGDPSYNDSGHCDYRLASGGQTGTAKDIDEKAQPNTRHSQEQKKRRWALRARVGTALPIDGGDVQMPLAAGVTVERKLNDRFGIETGLLYSNLRQAGQRLHRLGIPVRLNATLLDREKFDLYAFIGGVADKCIASSPDRSYSDESLRLALTAGIGINYKLNDRLSVFAEPGISHRFNEGAPIAQQPKRETHLNLLCGVRMTY